MNTGERGEFLVKFKLVELRDKHRTFNGEEVIDVGFDRSYRSPRLEYGTFDIGRSDRDDLIYKIAQEMNIEKGGMFDKSDVYINGKGYSLKSTAGANSALINHTRRDGFERVCKEIGTDIGPLDRIVEEYWRLRLSGKIGEDVYNSDPNSPFAAHKAYFGPILEYFLFTGTGSRRSYHPAEYILEYLDPSNEKTWKIVTKKDAVNEVWPKLVFSMRSKKGMPPDYTLAYRGANHESIAKWVRVMQGEYKGALHVRVADGQRQYYNGP